jgi:hypothetical protein
LSSASAGQIPGKSSRASKLVIVAGIVLEEVFIFGWFVDRVHWPRARWKRRAEPGAFVSTIRAVPLRFVMVNLVHKLTTPRTRWI